MSQERCFKVYYTKHIHRKKKVYSEGVLLSNNQTAKLFDCEGLPLLKFKTKETFVLEEQYTINHTYLILIDEEIDAATFHTGKIFMPEPIVLKKKPKPKLKLKPVESADVKLDCGLFVDSHLHSILRKHQLAGVEFMFRCVAGLKKEGLNGCILADFMGLGKTLQVLTLAYSMLRQGSIKKFIVVCPLTLLSVWQKQTKKWLDNKLNPLICYGKTTDTMNMVKNYTQNQYRMLVISYESFYRCIERLSGKVDMIVFDEGHRLKNKKSKLLIKMKSFRCEKRILLTGTPIQNNLEELFTCASIVYPHIFNNQTLFRNVFQKPIMEGMGKSVTQEQRMLAQQRTDQLSLQLMEFSLRRTADVLEQYLPKKREIIVFFKLTPLQKLWYDRLLETTKTCQAETLKTLNELRKLFTHPLIFKSDKINKNEIFTCPQQCCEQTSYKIEFLLHVVRQVVDRGEKVVIVSYFTETLDFVEKALRQRLVTSTKLDGRLKGSDRKKILNLFENEKSVLLLSGKAGGTGLTLTCACTMIMIQPDWNPSNDSQVMGRVWRQGQKKQVSIYRLIVGCSFQEKMLQRQNMKKSLSNQLIDQRQSQQNFDLSTIGKLFIENQEKVLTFSKEQNQLDCVQDLNYDLSKKGIFFIKQNVSHKKDAELINEFGKLDFQKAQEQPEISETETQDSEQKQQQKVKKPKYKQKKDKKLFQEKKQSNKKQKQQEREKQQQQKLQNNNQSQTESPNQQSVTIFKESSECQKIIQHRKNGKIDTSEINPVLKKFRFQKDKIN